MPNQVNQYITEVQGQAQFADALNSFSAQCAANADVLKLDPPQLAEIAQAATKVTQKLDAWFEAKEAANQAGIDKNDEIKTAKGIVSTYAKTFRADPTISDALLGLLMLAPHNPPKTSTPPAQPGQCNAKGDLQGFVYLKWGRGGNGSGTIFTIEYRLQPSGPWTVLGTTLKSTFAYQATPGEFVQFRVVAQRKGQSSPPSLPATLWDYSSDNVVMLKAA